MNHDITYLFSKYKNTHIQIIVVGVYSQLNVYIRSGKNKQGSICNSF
jgi:hypothetical protein